MWLVVSSSRIRAIFACGTRTHNSRRALDDLMRSDDDTALCLFVFSLLTWVSLLPFLCFPLSYRLLSLPVSVSLSVFHRLAVCTPPPSVFLLPARVAAPRQLPALLGLRAAQLRAAGLLISTTSPSSTSSALIQQQSQSQQKQPSKFLRCLVPM